VLLRLLASSFRIQTLASPLTDLPEFLDLLLVVNSIDSMHIKIYQIHIGLQEGRQFLGSICLDKQEPRAATGQIIPSLDAFVMGSTSLILLQNMLGDGFARSRGAT